MLKNEGKVRTERVYKEGKKPQTRTYTIATCPVCQNKFEALLDNIKRGTTTSCGCYKTQHIELVKTPTYKSWQGLKDRCTNTKLPCYKRYGARGITYDPKWERFDGFLEDMGICPLGKSLDRIDNNGNYCKENCRWATPTEQANNRRTSLYLEYNGKKDTLANLCRELKLDYKSTWHKIKHEGKTLEQLRIMK